MRPSPRAADGRQEVAVVRPTNDALRVLVLGLSLLTAAASASATEIRWRLPNGGTFNSTGSWFGAFVPTSGDVAVFGLTPAPNPFPPVPESYTVQFTADRLTQGLRVEDDLVTYDLNGHTHSFDPLLSQLAIGTVNGVSGRLAITDGLVDNSGPVSLGLNGGTGRLMIHSLGRLESVSQALVGFTSGGTVDVMNTGSWDHDGEITVGALGGGALNISSGGHVVSNSGVVGLSAVGAATVTGADSQWGVGSLSVGRDATGTLDITAGGDVQCQGVLIASEPSHSGTVTVAGGDATWFVANKLGIGVNTAMTAEGGAGTVRIQPGGFVLVGQDTVLGDGDALHLEGGSLTANAIKFIGMTKPFFWTSGRLGVSRYEGNLTVPDGGVLEPVASATGTEIVGAYDQQAAGAKLAVEILGASPNSYGRVTVHGAATLGGILQLDLGNAFLPSAIDTFHILEAIGDITTSFANVANGERLAVSNSFGSFRVNYGANSAFGPLAANDIFLDQFQPGADFNNSGMVDAADLALWKTGFGTVATATHALGDANRDGSVDGADFLIWQRQVGGPVAIAAVPEPRSASLIVANMAAAAAVARRRRRTVGGSSGSSDQ
jgi:T5SS/PEP-CTERM-associated repeat protein